jgi:hypothetical protein
MPALNTTMKIVELLHGCFLKEADFEMSASPTSSAKPAFRAKAGSHDQVESRLAALHAHIRDKGLEPHNVSIHNRNTGVVHNAVVAHHGVHQRSYRSLDEMACTGLLLASGIIDG